MESHLQILFDSMLLMLNVNCEKLRTLYAGFRKGKSIVTAHAFHRNCVLRRVTSQVSLCVWVVSAEKGVNSCKATMNDYSMMRRRHIGADGFYRGSA